MHAKRSRNGYCRAAVNPSKTGIAFAVVVVLCLAQVAWWIVFQFRESARFEQAARALANGDQSEAMAALGVDAAGVLDDRFRRHRFMFASEGAFLGLCALAGVVFFYAVLLRERRVLPTAVGIGGVRLRFAGSLRRSLFRS
jgi:hypothetical protein